MVGFTLLVGGCGEKYNEEKTLLMVSPEDLTEVEGITYFTKKDGTSKPYTGWSVFKQGSVKLTEVFYENGKKHGLYIRYREDGSKESETPYVEGKKHGLYISYWKDGSKRWGAHTKTES